MISWVAQPLTRRDLRGGLPFSFLKGWAAPGFHLLRRRQMLACHPRRPRPPQNPPRPTQVTSFSKQANSLIWRRGDGGETGDGDRRDVFLHLEESAVLQTVIQCTVSISRPASTQIRCNSS